MHKTILGIFQNQSQVEGALDQLQDNGYDAKDVSLIMKDQENRVATVDEKGNPIAEGAVGGATTGGVLGGIAGLLIGVGVLAIPGVGALLIGGPLAAALGLTGAAATTVSGAVTGALAGGLIGALTGLGVSEEDARVYEDKIKQGAILVAVPTAAGNEGEVRTILQANGADQIRSVEDRDSFRRQHTPTREEQQTVTYASEIKKDRDRDLDPDLDRDIYRDDD
jgi:hypothetical protein